jgi:hypothetical protein
MLQAISSYENWHKLKNQKEGGNMSERAFCSLVGGLFGILGGLLSGIIVAESAKCMVDAQLRTILPAELARRELLDFKEQASKFSGESTAMMHMLGSGWTNQQIQEQLLRTCRAQSELDIYGDEDLNAATTRLNAALHTAVANFTAKEKGGVVRDSREWKETNEAFARWFTEVNRMRKAYHDTAAPTSVRWKTGASGSPCSE